MMRQNIPYAKQVMLPAVSALKSTCQCGYVWAYRGLRQHASCPKCRSMVTLQPKRKGDNKSCKGKEVKGADKSKL